MEEKNEKQNKFRLEIVNTLAKCDDIPDASKYYEDLRIYGEGFFKNKENKEVLSFLEAIGNQDRYIILLSLLTKDRCICELEAILQKPQPTISRHIRILEEANLLRGWKKGRFTHLSLIRKNFKKLQTVVKNWNEAGTNWFGEIQ